jgi:hypothetical protein
MLALGNHNDFLNQASTESALQIRYPVSVNMLSCIYDSAKHTRQQYTAALAQI